METLDIEDFKEEGIKEESGESAAEIKMWAEAALQHFNEEYAQLLEKHTTRRGELVVKNLAGLKNVMEQSVNEHLADGGSSAQEKRSAIKDALDSYMGKRDALLATLGTLEKLN